MSASIHVLLYNLNIDDVNNIQSIFLSVNSSFYSINKPKNRQLLYVIFGKTVFTSTLTTPTTESSSSSVLVLLVLVGVVVVVLCLWGLYLYYRGTQIKRNEKLVFEGFELRKTTDLNQTDGKYFQQTDTNVDDHDDDGDYIEVEIESRGERRRTQPSQAWVTGNAAQNTGNNKSVSGSGEVAATGGEQNRARVSEMDG